MSELRLDERGVEDVSVQAYSMWSIPTLTSLGFREQQRQDGRSELERSARARCLETDRETFVPRSYPRTSSLTRTIRRQIIFGADVYHAAPGSLNPSIAGLVSSTNREVTDYTSSISVQRCT